MAEPLIDRDFAEKFLTAADRPLDYGVYFLFHEWWTEAPQDAIDAYLAELRSLPGAAEFLAARHLAEPLSLERLEDCAPGTLGEGYRRFIVDNGLMENLARDYRAFNEQLTASGKLDRLPEDMSFAIVRGFQIHDFLHVMTGFRLEADSVSLPRPRSTTPSCSFPYHAMRMAVTTAHFAFVAPQHTTEGMDAIVAGWQLGRASQNLHFERWEDQLDVPIAEIRERVGIDATRRAA